MTNGNRSLGRDGRNRAGANFVTDRTIRLDGVRKAFGRNAVLRGIDLELPAGTITVLMGANGAGKSTLVKILCGVHGADAGRILLGGQPFAPASPSDALASGVVTVHQNINDGVVPGLDVATNLVLDELPRGALFLNQRAIRARARAIAAQVGLHDLDMRAEVRHLGLAERQMVAIARAMARSPRLLILDEPTSSLSAVEAERLFALVERLRAKGVAILYISHRMGDIRRLADRIVAMRDGAISGRFERAPLDIESAVRAMLGHAMAEVRIDIPAPGAPVLEARGLVLRPGARAFDLDARAGEVLAVTGLVGSGKSALAGALFGVALPLAGAMRLDGADYVPASPGDAVARGVFLSPKDRLQNAVVRDFDITRNLTLPFLRRHASGGFLSRRSERTAARAVVAEMGVVCQSPGDPITTLSGGNQQKVVVGRWLSQPSRLLILDEPFQGVDIQARRDIGARIRATAPGRATIVLATEIDEALEIADRILVMSEGTVVGEHVNRGIDLGRLMAQVVDAPGARAVTAE